MHTVPHPLNLPGMVAAAQIGQDGLTVNTATQENQRWDSSGNGLTSRDRCSMYEQRVLRRAEPAARLHSASGTAWTFY